MNTTMGKLMVFVLVLVIVVMQVFGVGVNAGASCSPSSCESTNDPHIRGRNFQLFWIALWVWIWKMMCKW